MLKRLLRMFERWRIHDGKIMVNLWEPAGIKPGLQTRIGFYLVDFSESTCAFIGMTVKQQRVEGNVMRLCCFWLSSKYIKKKNPYRELSLQGKD